jgi:hypothetical protein
MTSAFNAVSASPTVIDTGPLLIPAQAVESVAVDVMVGAAFVVSVRVGVVVTTFVEPV